MEQANGSSDHFWNQVRGTTESSRNAQHEVGAENLLLGIQKEFASDQARSLARGIKKCTKNTGVPVLWERLDLHESDVLYTFAFVMDQEFFETDEAICNGTRRRGTPR